MNTKPQKRSIDNIVVLIVFATFAFSVLMVLMLGAGVYRNISDITQSAENERTALSYILTKARNLDSSGAFAVGEFHGVSALYINEQIGGTAYQTVIYAHDGWLCEIFSEDLSGFTVNDGMRISPVHGLTFDLTTGGAISISAGYKSNASDYRNMLFYPRSGTAISGGGG